jgi:ubiquitin carboxyl-terminal hydrolase L3
MKQTISNACGTVAMIHAVANNRDVIKLDDGFLKTFLDSTKDDTPEEKAKKLEGDQVSQGIIVK